MGQKDFEEDVGKLSSNWMRKQPKCKCRFFLVPFQTLLSSQGRRRLCRILHAEQLNEFFLMKVGGNEAATDSHPQLCSVIVPKARQLLPPASKWKGSSARIFKEDFDRSKLEQLQNIQIELNEKALDSLLHFGRRRKGWESASQLQLSLALKILTKAGETGISWRQEG